TNCPGTSSLWRNSVSRVVGPSEPVVAIVGDDTVLPCHLDPAVNAADMTVEWTRSDLTPRFVHVWRDGVELVNKKNVAYMERTSLPINNLKLGDISLKLSKVKLSDRGSYKCFSPALSGQASVDLHVDILCVLIPGDLFNPSCSSAAHITIAVVVTVLLILAVVLVVWKYRSKRQE
uniref:Ig-like domain-containing protein n=1 Tax=Neolamprologus brichardi TaxID=32507 RepID=A0A3Q4I9P9_NEOBR